MATRTVKDKASSQAERIAGFPVGEFLRPDFPMLQLMTRPFEFWLRCQHDVLTAVEPVTLGWLERRREAAQALLEAIEKLSSCGDLGEIASVQGQWLEGAMKRLESDLRALNEQALVFSQEAVSATRYAAQKPEAVEQAAE